MRVWGVARLRGRAVVVLVELGRQRRVSWQAEKGVLVMVMSLLMVRSQSEQCGGKRGLGVAVEICACAYLFQRNETDWWSCPEAPRPRPAVQ